MVETAVFRFWNPLRDFKHGTAKPLKPPILSAAMTGEDPYPRKKHASLRAIAGGISGASRGRGSGPPGSSPPRSSCRAAA